MNPIVATVIVAVYVVLVLKLAAVVGRALARQGDDT